jgi:transposase
MSKKERAEECVRFIRGATRKQYSSEEKIRIFLEVVRSEQSIAELCRREQIAQSFSYAWSEEFLEAGKKRLSGDTAREATSDEVKQLRPEASDLKEALTETLLENRLLKKARTGLGTTKDEVPGRREVGDYSARLGFTLTGEADAGNIGCVWTDVLSLVCAL